MTDAAGSAAPRQRLSADARAEQLLDVADELFKTNGYDGTSIEDIAREAGVTRPIVYQHHGSKEGVYLACIERARRELIREFRPILMEETDPYRALQRACARQFEIAERDPARWKVLISSALPLVGPLGERLREHTVLSQPALAVALQRWMPSERADEVEAIAVMTVGATDHLLRWWLDHRDVPKESLIDLLVEYCWGALAPIAGHAQPPPVTGD